MQHRHIDLFFSRLFVVPFFIDENLRYINLKTTWQKCLRSIFHYLFVLLLVEWNQMNRQVATYLGRMKKDRKYLFKYKSFQVFSQI